MRNRPPPAGMDDSSLHLAGKRGALVGGAVSAEVLSSSPTLLQQNRGGSLTGLQQYFTPPEVGHMLRTLHGTGHATLDPTAGNGSLLQAVYRSHRYAIEIDPDQVDPEFYEGDKVLIADLQQAAPQLVRAGTKFERIHANPPFGLRWKAPDGSDADSMTVTWAWTQRLLHEHGLGAFIAGRDRFMRQVLPREDAAGVYALLHVDDLFDGVSLPVTIALFTSPENRTTSERMDVTTSRAELPGLAASLMRVVQRATKHVNRYTTIASQEEAMNAVRLELERRRNPRRHRSHDVTSGRGRIEVLPSPVTRIGLAKDGLRPRVERLHKQPFSYFALNNREWDFLVELAEQGTITIEPSTRERVEQAQREAQLTMCPMYPLKPQQRLAYLDDLDNILCVVSDPEREFEAGKRYPITTSSRTATRRYQKVNHGKSGLPDVRKFTEEAQVLDISIAKHQFSETPDDVNYLVAHFDIPDPGDVGTRFPEAIAQQHLVLDKLQSEREWSYKAFQREDLARMLVKGRGLLAWEQGLGKSLGGLSLALASFENGAKRRGLIIAPQDLVPQWQKEAEFFYDLKLEHIRTLADAHRVKRHLDAGGEGLFITHFEALSQVGSKNVPLPPRMFHLQDSKRQSLHSSEFCPGCGASGDEGWQRHAPLVCSAKTRENRPACGYVHKQLMVRNAGSVLSKAFADGVIVIDEGTLFKGDTSRRSKTIRGMRAAHRYVLTGTPISNYVNDAFWLMWWALGNASSAFPYAYDGGRSKFEDDFCVIEYMMGSEKDGKGNRKERRKVLPQVTNVSRLWRLLSGTMVRRRKEDTGEPIVARTMREVHVPMGTAQKQIYDHWLTTSTFVSFFSDKYPDHSLVEANQVERFAAALGQLQKLEYATTMPAADPDLHWSGALPGVRASNFTPKNMRVLELAIKHAENGEKVLIGSCNIATGLWLAERLCEAGIRAVHITEDTGTGAQTMSPRKRASVMHEFRHGSAQVLCCGIPSIRLGHNLDTASTVIINGLVYSYEMFDQFIARAHRLTSKRDVSVYIPQVNGAFDPVKWDLLTRKAAAADLALDGELSTERNEPINMEKVLADLKAQGAAFTGDTIDETSLEAAWKDRIALIAPAAPQVVVKLEPVKRLTHVALTDSAEQMSLFG